MSGLRLFSDIMHQAIAAERRLREIETNAERYVRICEAIRSDNLPRTDRPAAAFHQANEGIAATRIILAASGKDGTNG